MLLSLTITRAGLSLPDLVITNDPTVGDFWLPEDGLEEPGADWRRTYMPDHPDIHGKQLLSAALEHDSLPVVVYTSGTTSTDLAAKKETLRAALGQFHFYVTLNQDGAEATYSADVCAPRWGAVDSGMVRGKIARASVVIPVYPIAS